MQIKVFVGSEFWISEIPLLSFIENWDVTNPSPLNKSRPEILRKVRFLREIE